jgi:hypothetical protein
MMLVAGGLRLSYTDARSTHFNFLNENGTIKPLPSPVEQAEVGGIDMIVDKVMAQLKPFMEKLVCEAFQTITEDIKKHVTHSATMPPPTNEAEDWESMFLEPGDEPIQSLDPAPSSPPPIQSLDPPPSSPPPIDSRASSVCWIPPPPQSQARAEETSLAKAVLPHTPLQHNDTMVSPPPCSSCY